MKIENAEKRKITRKSLQNGANKLDFNQKNAQNKFTKEDLYVLSWIKTILTIKRFLPNIIYLVDKHIISMAESSYSSSFIFGDMKNGTYNQVEQIIEMEQRKMSLLNIKMLIEELFGSLEEKQKDFVNLKYFQNKNFPYVSLELEIDERTSYRWNKIILIKLLKFCKLNNYSKEFFKSQLAEEKWVLPHYEKCHKSIITLFGKS